MQLDNLFLLGKSQQPCNGMSGESMFLSVISEPSLVTNGRASGDRCDHYRFANAMLCITKTTILK